MRKAGGSVLREDSDGWGQVDVEENWGVTGKAGFFQQDVPGVRGHAQVQNGTSGKRLREGR